MSFEGIEVNEKRGTFDYRFDYNEEIFIFKWVDNKCVTVGMNYDTVRVQPIRRVQRWQGDIKI